MTGPGPQPRRRRSRATRLTLAGLLTLPLVELIATILVGQAIGAPATALLLLLLSLVGLVVLRRGGVGVARSLSPDARAAAAPTGADRQAARDAGWLLLGGALLVIPGFVTAAAGLLLMLPPVRRALGPLLGRGAGIVVSRLIGAPLMGRVVGTQVVEGDIVEATEVGIRVVEPTTPPVSPGTTTRSGDESDRKPGDDG